MNPLEKRKAAILLHRKYLEDLESSGKDKASSICDIDFKLPESFTKPFREEFDSRAEYKTQAEGAIFNEREKFYDEISNILSKFKSSLLQDDVQVGLTSQRKEILQEGTTLIRSLRPCNTAWCSEMMIQLLQYHSISNPSAKSYSRPTKTQNPENLSENSRTQEQTSMKKKLNADAPSFVFQSTTNQTNIPQASTLAQLGSFNPFQSQTLSDLNRPKPLQVPVRRKGDICDPPGVAPGSLTKSNNVFVNPRHSGTTFYSTNIRDPGTTQRQQQQVSTRVGGKQTAVPVLVAAAVSKENQSSTAIKHFSLASAKQAKLEARLGPNGGHSGINPFSKGSQEKRGSIGFKVGKDGFSEVEDGFLEVSKGFIGMELFFFYLIVILNDYRFNQWLITSLVGEITRLAEGNGLNEENIVSLEVDEEDVGESEKIEKNEKENGSSRLKTVKTSSSVSMNGNFLSSKDLTLLLRKLKVLGKFLGVLLFYPFWALEKDLSASRPLQAQLIHHAQKRSFLQPPINIQKILEKSWSGGNLCVHITWVVECLKMLKWDSPVLKDPKINPFLKELKFLRLVQLHKLFFLEQEFISNNRVYISMIIEDLWDFFPIEEFFSQKDQKPLPKLSIKESEISGHLPCVDDGNHASSVAFVHHLIPDLLLINPEKSNKTKVMKIAPTLVISGEFDRKELNNISLLNRNNESEPKETKKLIKVVTPRKVRKQSFDLTSNQELKSTTCSLMMTSPTVLISPSTSTRRSSSRGSPVQGQIINSTESLDPKEESVEKLEIAFWSGHSLLKQASTFLLNHSNHSCLIKIRDLVGTAVQELLSIINHVKLDLSNDKKLDEATYLNYTNAVEASYKRVYNETINEGEIFLNDFYENFKDNVAPMIFRMMPIEPRILKLCLFLTFRQSQEQKFALFGHLKAYSRRKLKELCELTSKHQKKIKLNNSSEVGKIKELNIFSSIRLNEGCMIDENKILKHRAELLEQVIIGLKEIYSGENFELDWFFKRKYVFSSEYVLQNEGRIVSLCILKGKILKLFSLINVIITGFCKYAVALGFNMNNQLINDDITQNMELNNGLVNLCSLNEAIVEKITRLLAASTSSKEFIGKIAIEATRFITVNFPFFLFLDMVKLRCLSRKQHFGINEIFCEEREIIFPSNIVLNMFENKIFDIIDPVIRAIEMTLRIKTLAFYQNCKGLVGLLTENRGKSNYLINVIKFLLERILHTQFKFDLNTFQDIEWYKELGFRQTIYNKCGLVLANFLNSFYK